MPDPITWYALGRQVGDAQSISEAIDVALLSHNLDPSAHSQSGEAIDNHREAAVLDHVAYSIYNIKTSPAARVYKAIVSGGLDGDFSSLQAAIDWANLYGGGTVFVKAGTYYLNSDITLYSNIEIIGEDNDTVIFDFGHASKMITAQGTSGTHKNNIWLRNIQIKNADHATLTAIYFLYVDDCGVENCHFVDNEGEDAGAGGDIYFDSCTRGSIKDNYSVNPNNGIKVNLSTACNVENNHIDGAINVAISFNGGTSNCAKFNYVDTAGGVGISVDTASKTKIIGNFIKNCVNLGIICGYNSGADYCTITDNYIEGTEAGGVCIFVGSASSGNVISNNTLYNNDADGINLDDADKNAVVSNTVINGGTGIYLGTNASYNTCVGNVLYGNGTNLSNIGSNNQVGNNVAP